MTTPFALVLSRDAHEIPRKVPEPLDPRQVASDHQRERRPDGAAHPIDRHGMATRISREQITDRATRVGQRRVCTSFSSVYWIVPIIASVFFGLGICIVFLASSATSSIAIRRTRRRRWPACSWCGTLSAPAFRCSALRRTRS